MKTRISAMLIYKEYLTRYVWMCMLYLDLISGALRQLFISFCL